MMHTTLEEVLGVLEEAVKLRAKSEQIFAKSMGLDADQAVKRQKDKETEEQVYSSLQALRCLLGDDALDKVLNIVCSKNAVKKYEAQASGRQCHRVNGEQSTYVCFSNPSGLYCSCRSFEQRYWHSIPYCKHLLAIKIVQALGKEEVTVVPDSEFAKYLIR